MKPLSQSPRLAAALLGSVLIATGLGAVAAPTSPQAQLAEWTTAAGKPASAERGRTFFTTQHGKDISCASCHGSTPTGPGKHVSTGKVLEPLAPAANPKSLTDSAKVAKWFKRNCNDVLGRECSAQEKADVLAFLTSLQK
jgi:mono/diheme cytochrome c family protein